MNELKNGELSPSFYELKEFVDRDSILNSYPETLIK